ncbi:MAG: hypothetical protein J7556_14885 [Acidovorax sp.]|nr:hypothetical protein [Acidovorax sp.]
MKDAAWLIAAVVALGMSAVAGHDYEADAQDAAAMTSREWAGQRVCGPDATPEWIDDKTLQCLRHTGQPVRMAGGQP